MTSRTYKNYLGNADKHGIEMPRMTEAEWNELNKNYEDGQKTASLVWEAEQLDYKIFKQKHAVTLPQFRKCEQCGYGSIIMDGLCANCFSIKQGKT